MKIYCFYTKSSNIDKELYISSNANSYPFLSIKRNEEKNVLYAVTDNKKMANRFSALRNLKCIVEHIDKEEYNKLINNGNLSDLEIINGNFVTDKRDKEFKKAKFIKIPCTRIEHEICTISKDSTIAYIFDKEFRDWEFLIDDIVMRLVPFKKKINSALNDYLLFSDIMCNMNPREDLNLDICAMDEAAVFIYLFKNTLKDMK